jgi:diguanylate cyclase (GGDEF)-like protein
MAQSMIPRLLLIEDDLDAADLICETLRDHFHSDCVQHFSTASQGLTADVSAIDLVLTDMNLPDGTGLELLEKLLLRRPDLPVVLVTAEGVLENAIAAIRRGAYDYVVKAGDYLFAIPIVVEKNLALWKTKQENVHLQTQLQHTLEQVRIKNQQLEEAVAKLETMAATDPLTGLANRRAFGRAVERYFAEAVRHDHDLSCIMIDLDGFKQLNDTLGHQMGDHMLQRAARVLEANCRRSDVAGRFGGDEFVVLLPQTDDATAAHVAQRIGGEFTALAAAELAQRGGNVILTMSMGLATRRHSRATSPEQLIACADHALYRAKHGGKGELALFHQPPAATPPGHRDPSPARNTP